MAEFEKPAILKLDGDVEANFEVFRQEVEIFFIATETTKKSKETQVARLLNIMGAEARKIYFQIKEDIEEQSVSAILDALKLRCIPKRNLVMSQFKFFQRRQNQSEPFDKYYTDLKELVKHCQFKDAEKQLLCTQIVLGIQNKESQQKLLEKNLDLEQTVRFCQSIELSEKSRHEIESISVAGQEAVSINRAEVKSFKQQHNRDFKGKKSYSNKKTVNKSVGNKSSYKDIKYLCKKCNNEHGPKSCPAFGKKCSNCSKMNHFAVGCKNKKVRAVDIRETDSSDEYFNINSIVRVLNEDSNLAKTKWIQSIQINNLNVEIKLDTGAEVSILPYSLYIKLVPKPAIEKCEIKIETFGGFLIEPLGIIWVECQAQDKIKIKGKFLVVNDLVNHENCKKKIEAILGSELCEKLNLVKRVRAIKKENQIINNNIDVFTGLGLFPEKCKLVLKENASPVINTARRVPLSIKDKLKDTLEHLEKIKVIATVNEPVDWMSNIVIVEKPNKKLRICLDPQDLNRALKTVKYPIPTLKEIIPKLKGKKWFTVVDLSDGFWQVGLDDESSKLCNFSTPFGTYKFLRLPFGLNVSPEIFQSLLNKYFSSVKDLIIYFDDIMISADTKEEHDTILNQVIKIARENNIKFNKNKIQYGMNEVKFLGFLFNEHGMRPDPQRVKVINELIDPLNKTELQRILGMVNYLRDFLPKISEIISPLRELLKKDKIWVWNESHSAVLKEVKHLIANASILTNFDPNIKVEIQCDASQNAIGCCLLQNKKPVCFLSRSLTDTEIGYAQIEKELLAVTFSCQKLHNYIYGNNNITIYTDHQPLVSIIKKGLDKIQNNRIKRLRMKLFLYTFDLVYLPGKFMYIADLLSRNNIKDKSVKDDESMKDKIHTVKAGEIKFSKEKSIEYKKNMLEDETLKMVTAYYKNGWPKSLSNSQKDSELIHYSKLKNDITMEGDLLYWNNRLLIPKKTRREILELLHETHLGVHKTKLKARQHCYWPGINSNIENFVLSCTICQQISYNNTKEPLIQHEIPEIPFLKLGADIAEWAGKKYFVIVDYYSKWLEVIPIRSTNSTTLIDCCKEIFARFGIPDELIADNMPFESYEFKQFSVEYKFKIITSSPYYPRSNGLAEKFVGIAKKMIKKSSREKKDLQLFLLNYRNTPVLNSKYSPAQLLMSKVLNTKLPIKKIILEPRVVNAKEEVKKERLRAKTYYDRTAKERKDFKVNEQVLVKDITKKEWVKGVIIKKLEVPRSYLVEINKVRYRRNAYHLKKITVRNL